MKTEKEFPNGFTSWTETHHEVVRAIALADNGCTSVVVSSVAGMKGTGGLYELAEELTDKFEELHKDTEWDGEFFDVVEEFLIKELKL